jgi:preprotein translocase subunit SecG
MINIIYIFLTILMFLDCILLVLLVLLQLPKKEAGAGMAFGGAATDALFGAGSGNVLTKITKYVAGVFFGLAILMALMASHKAPSSAASLFNTLQQQSAGPKAIAPPPAASVPSDTAPASTPPPAGGLLQLSNVAPASGNNAAPAVSTNAAPVSTNH